MAANATGAGADSSNRVSEAPFAQNEGAGIPNASERRKLVADKAHDLSMAASRHTADDEDATVLFLGEMEHLYADDPVNLAKCRALTVHPDCVEFGALDIRMNRANETRPEGSIGVYRHGDGRDYFLAHTAIQMIELIPSDTEWLAMRDACPGKNDKERNEFLVKLLGIKRSGAIQRANGRTPLKTDPTLAQVWARNTRSAEALCHVSFRPKLPQTIVWPENNPETVAYVIRAKKA